MVSMQKGLSSSINAIIRSASAKPLLIGPKRQHFLPKFYLEGFCKDGMLAVFDREAGEIRVQQPQNTGVIGHFYTFEDEEGRKRFELEQILSEIEGKASPSLRKLSEGKNLNEDERENLAIFVSIAAFRTPDLVDSLKSFNSKLVRQAAKRIFSDVDRVKATMRERRGSTISEESEQELKDDAKAMIDLAQSDSYEVITNHSWAVRTGLALAFEIAPLIAERNWLVLHRSNEKKSFVTTDAPVALTTIEPRKPSFWGVGYGNSDALVIFPLTQSCTLLAFGEGAGLQHKEASDDDIRQINLSLAERCQRFVIGRDEALVRSITERLGLAGKKWAAKFQRI